MVNDIRKNLTKQTGRSATFVLALLVIFVLQSCTSKTEQVDKQLMTTASELNKTLPTMIDNMTRLDNVSAAPGKVIQYNYTIITDQQLDYSVLKENLKPSLVNNMKTHPDMKSFRDNDVKVMYSYKDEQGDFLFKIEIGPEQYK